MPIHINIFNQYYFGFLKKVKDIARNLKHSSSSKDPKDPELLYNKILKAIKNSYASYDTSSNEYHEWFINNEELQNAYEQWSISVKTYKDIETWILDSNVKDSEIYKDISINDIHTVIDKKYTLYYNIAILYIFSHDITDVQLTHIVQLIKNLKEKELFDKEIAEIENENIRNTLQVLMEIQQETLSTTFESSFKELEETSLGKLAKEIMSDINLDEIQTSLQKEDDILKALSNPDGGLTKLLGSVSQKMISKMASGEIKQETLLQDAMAFSSQIRNMTSGGNNEEGGMGGLGGLGDIGSMLEQFQKMTSGNGNGGLGNIQEMMASMGMGMGAGGNQRQQKNGGHRTQTRIDTSKMNRVIQAKQLRNKLEKKKQQAKMAKENVQTHVEDE
jgi:hypothetical protein